MDGVLVAEDRAFRVSANETVKVEWVDIDRCQLGNRTPMSPEAVEKKWRTLLNNNGEECWPPVRGRWEGDRFVILDGRHHYVASLMFGRTEILVAWKEPRNGVTYEGLTLADHVG
jgi:hypothetical protein